MYAALVRAVRLVLLPACLAAFAATALAEKVDVKFTKNARAMHAESKTPPSGAGGRETVRFFYVDTIDTSKGLDFVVERGANRDYQVDGSGTHSGTAVDVLKNGEEIYQIYAGSHKTTTKADGSWEVNYEGISNIVGGTGIYKNAKGKLRYKGRITEKSLWEEDEGQITY